MTWWIIEGECVDVMRSLEPASVDHVIAVLVSIYERQRENEPEEGWPEGDLHPGQVLQAIGETIGQPCSICRSRHGSGVRHAAE